MIENGLRIAMGSLLQLSDECTGGCEKRSFDVQLRPIEDERVFSRGLDFLRPDES